MVLAEKTLELRIADGELRERVSYGELKGCLHLKRSRETTDHVLRLLRAVIEQHVVRIRDLVSCPTGEPEERAFPPSRALRGLPMAASALTAWFSSSGTSPGNMMYRSKGPPAPRALPRKASSATRATVSSSVPPAM